MDRRSWLHASGTSLLGLALGGCATRSASLRLSGPEARLTPVLAGWDRIIRTTVGLRPFRPSGFVVRAERFDEKTVIHNYGHGGAGHSLGWGTGLMAAELALEHETRRAAVIGCGTVGLTTARQLQRRGFDVTIYAASVPPDTTSNKALAAYTPRSGLFERHRTPPSWEARWNRAARIGYYELQSLAGRGYGVSWIASYRFMTEAPRGRLPSGPLPERLSAPDVILAPGEHPFPSPYAARRPYLRIEPAIYLDAMVRDVRAFGSRIVVRSFDRPDDLLALDETLIVNCTGLGSRTLFDDAELIPVKGQLTFLVPQAEVDYATFGGVPGRTRGDGFVHMMPRRDGIALGGTTERGVFDLSVNESARQRIVETHMELFAGMRVGPFA